MKTARTSAVVRRVRLALLALAGVSLLGGCAYYNGMYNTNRLAKSARKAERDGRTFEATSLWGQVITRADTLLVRHPRSKYAGQANVLRGLALARLGQCPAAITPLANLDLLHGSRDLAEEAALALGRCQFESGDPAGAELAFTRVVDSPDSARRREARFQRGRALRAAGRYEEALALIQETSDPRGRGDLLVALAGSGRSDAAFALADSLLTARDSTLVWDSVVAMLGRHDPRTASDLVGKLQVDTRLTPELRARRLLEDALRLAEVDSSRARARLEESARVPGARESAERARLRLLRLDLAVARTLDDLAGPADSLAALSRRVSSVAGEAALLQSTVERVRQLADSAGPGSPQGDLRLFFGAESARDSIGAPTLAASLFRQVADEWPFSPYAPKALLAAGRLDPAAADMARVRLDSLYVDSPYLAVARGEDAPGYKALEDSLEAFALAHRGGAPKRPVEGPGPGGRVRPAPDGPVEPVRPRRQRQEPDEDVPGRPRNDLRP